MVMPVWCLFKLSGFLLHNIEWAHKTLKNNFSFCNSVHSNYVLNQELMWGWLNKPHDQDTDAPCGREGRDGHFIGSGSPTRQKAEEAERYPDVKGSTDELILPPTTTYLPFSESTFPFRGSKIKPQL